MERFRDQVVIVTGASRGIGRAIAEAFAREGARVAVNYRADGAGAQETARRIEAAGGKSTVIQADVSRAGDVERLVSQAEATLGAVDVLVNNAGVVLRKSFLESTEADYDWQFATNVKGVYLMSHAVASRMRERSSDSAHQRRIR